MESGATGLTQPAKMGVLNVDLDCCCKKSMEEDVAELVHEERSKGK